MRYDTPWTDQELVIPEDYFPSIIHGMLCRGEITGKEFALWVIIAYLTGTEKGCSMTKKQLIKEVKVKERQLQNMLAKLQKLGLIHDKGPQLFPDGCEMRVLVSITPKKA